MKRLKPIVMKKMIYLAVAALLLAGAADAMAQGHYRGSHRHHYEHPMEGFGIHFGYVHSFNRTMDRYTEEKETASKKNGFNFGLTKDFTLIPMTLYIQTGLDYVYQVNKPDVNRIASIETIAKAQDHRLDIPVKLKYKHPVTPSINVFAQVGPTISFGLASRLKYRARIEDGVTATAQYNYFNGKIKTTGDAAFLEEYMQVQNAGAKYRAFDTFVGGAVGAEFFDILEASIGYDWGLVNQYKGDIAQDWRMRRQQFYLTVAVRF